jgi:hypothetical protein
VAGDDANVEKPIGPLAGGAGQVGDASRQLQEACQ